MSSKFMETVINGLEKFKFDLYNPYPQEKVLEYSKGREYVSIDLLALEKPYSNLAYYISFKDKGSPTTEVLLSEEEYVLLRSYVAENIKMDDGRERILNILNDE